MAMSKDRVKFRLRAYYFDFEKSRQLLKDSLGITWDQWNDLREAARNSPNQEIEIICRPSQFARFLIMREAAGFQNMFKELHAELVVPVPPVPQPVDVSRNPSTN
jgi:hypothetical protein